jgi:hypothetical protein
LLNIVSLVLCSKSSINKLFFSLLIDLEGPADYAAFIPI